MVSGLDLRWICWWVGTPQAPSCVTEQDIYIEMHKSVGMLKILPDLMYVYAYYGCRCPTL